MNAMRLVCAALLLFAFSTIGAREYDPVLKRFLSEDPIGIEGGPNLYTYVNGDPVNLTDPTGTQSITFGHGARHMLGTGVSPSTAQQAIAAQIRPILPLTTPGAGFSGSVNVGGTTIIFRAMPLPTGSCNIGTYYPK